MAFLLTDLHIYRFPQGGSASGAQDPTQGEQPFQDDGDDDLYS